jgi:hypothetical protein
VDWPPKIGEALSRPEDAWYEWTKVEDWILGPAGHSLEWSTVFHINLGDWGLLWNCLAEAVLGATIAVVRDRRPNGITCGVSVELSINGRCAPVTISWHYSGKDSAPRLVTAYPSP